MLPNTFHGCTLLCVSDTWCYFGICPIRKCPFPAELHNWMAVFDPTLCRPEAYFRPCTSSYTRTTDVSYCRACVLCVCGLQVQFKLHRQQVWAVSALEQIHQRGPRGFDHSRGDRHSSRLNSPGLRPLLRLQVSRNKLVVGLLLLLPQKPPTSTTTQAYGLHDQ